MKSARSFNSARVAPALVVIGMIVAVVAAAPTPSAVRRRVSPQPTVELPQPIVPHSLLPARPKQLG